MNILKKLSVLVVFIIISISACSPEAEPTSTPKPTAESTTIPKPTAVPTKTPIPTAVPTKTPIPTAVPTNTPTPTAEPTSTPVPQVEPTNTPKPTAEPTNTPKPTNTPELTAEPTRDLSTPEKILVGHWGLFAPGIFEPRQELYFGEFDEDGIAPCFWLKTEGTYTYTCRIIEDRIYTLLIGFSSEEYPDEFSEMFNPSSDGLTFWRANSVQIMQDQFQYIDSKTEP